MSDSEGFESADEEGLSSNEAPVGESSGKAEVDGEPSHAEAEAAAAAATRLRVGAPTVEPPLGSPPSPRAPPAAAAAEQTNVVEPSEQKLSASAGGSSSQAGGRAGREHAGDDDVCAKKIFDRLSEATERGQQVKAPAAAAVVGGGGSSSSWGSWGKWSSAILSTAVSSVSTFTGQVGEGLNAVLGLAPPSEAAPESWAEEVGGGAGSELGEGDGRVERCEPIDGAETVTSQPLTGDDDAGNEPGAGQLPSGEGSAAGTVSVAGANKEPSSSDWFAEWGVQGLAATVQSGTRSLVNSGLDVLESIGKKTVAVLAETDPGLKKTKSLFRSSSQTPSLSQLLREAKQRGEQAPAADPGTVVLTYSDLLEQFQGLAHFEALEMLSQKCSADLATIDRDSLDEKVGEASSILDDLAYTFSVDNVCTEAEPQEHSFVQLVSETVGRLALPLSTAKLAQAHARAREAVDKDVAASSAEARLDGDGSSDQAPSAAAADSKSAVELLHDSALRSLAELTACALELYHKFGELLLHGDADAERSAADYKCIAEDVASITRTMCNEVTLTSSCYTARLGLLSDAAATENITSVFVEATKSSTYIQDGYCLLLPIVQKAFAAHCLNYGR